MRRARIVLALSTLTAAGAALAPAGGCGSGNGTTYGPADGSSDGTATDGAGNTDVPTFADTGACLNGAPCDDGGGVCAGGTCCPSQRACGNACCASGQVCSFQACVTPGAICVDSSDCAPGQYCEFSLGSAADGGTGGTPEAGTDAGACVGGATLITGRCLPSPPVCAADAGAPDGGALTCLEKCEYHPPATAFSPVLEYAWGGQITSPFSSDVMMAPIVLPLEDTNCDGKVDARDIPDIVFTSFTGGAYTTNGTLHSIAVRSGKLVDRWSVPSAINPSTQLAGGDIDGNPGNEVVACGTDGAVHAYHGDGSAYWTSAAIACQFPSIADLNADGKVEVVVEGGVLDGATGATKVAKSFGTFVVSDIDGDGLLDIVSSSQGFHADGTLFVDTQTPGDWPAIGDFDKDGKPEIVAVYYPTHTVSFWHYDSTQVSKFSWVRQGVDINGTAVQHCPVGSAGYTTGGGPPTVADFNGDGTPDVALAGGIAYCVIDGSKVVDAAVANASTIMWTATTTDCSSAATGSSIFDFNGDGVAEVLYSDEEHLRVYQGPTGTVEWSTCNTTGTLEEFPLVADVDVDGHADIVVVSNAYASGNAEYQCNDGTNIAQSGVRVFGDANATWVRTRSIWNEHPYHITNVADDGTIPKNELPNWTQPGLNNFRQNKQPGGEFAAPDAVVSIGPVCGSPFALAATVRNIGEAALPAGVVVGFYAGKPPGGTKLGSMPTLLTLYPAESETLVLPLPNPPAGVTTGATPVYAVVDDGSPPHPGWHECRTDNNTSAAVSASCPGSN
jgi:hypothetical protein